ncbi:MAG: flagellar biosynthesis repressor FlbT [Pseudomonadota bacterium]
MAGLILKLRPNESVMINGAVIENGDRKTRLRIKTENANVLRLKDALTREEATTPLKQAYFVAQQAVAGEIPNDTAASMLADALHYLKLRSPEDQHAMLDAAADFLQDDRFFGVMRTLGGIIKDETQAA